MSETPTPVPAPADEPDIIPPGKPPPPPPPDRAPEPEQPPTERTSVMPRRAPDSRTRAPFPSWPEDKPDLIRDATTGIRGGSAQASIGHSILLDWRR